MLRGQIFRDSDQYLDKGTHSNKIAGAEAKNLVGPWTEHCWDSLQAQQFAETKCLDVSFCMPYLVRDLTTYPDRAGT